MANIEKSYFFCTMNGKGKLVLLEMENPPEKGDRNVIQLAVPKTQTEIKLLRAEGGSDGVGGDFNNAGRNRAGDLPIC